MSKKNPIRSYRDRMDSQLGDIMGQIHGSRPKPKSKPKKEMEEEKPPKKGSWW